MDYVLTPISKCIKKVSTWNPRQESEAEDFHYVDLSSLDKRSKSIALQNVELVSPIEAPSRARQLIAAGDVLVSTVRPNLNGVALVAEELDGATASTGYCVLRTEPKKLDSRYLFYWVQTPDFVESMMKQATGANYPAVSDRIVKESEIPLPPLSEQKRIAAILDKADALRRKRQQAIDLADQFLRSVFLDMFGDPVTNPKGWDTQLMSELVRLQGGFAFKSSDFVEAGIPVVKIGNANKGAFDITNLSFMPEDNSPSMRKYELFEGDMLLTLTGTVGKDDYGNVTRVPAGYSKWYLNQRVAKVEPCSSAVNSSYIEYLLSSPEIKREIIKASRGVRQANISNSDVYSLRVPVPSRQSQDQFEGIVKQLTTTRTKLKLMMLQLEDFFGSLSQKAFSGQL